MFMSAKPLASLSSGLLARKGQARPAMRPQAFAAPSAAALEDLGWNDMGPEPVAPTLPPVLVERAALAEEVKQSAADTVPPLPEATLPEPTPTDMAEPVAIAVVAPAPTLRGAGRAKAAFTLRLDSHRHLRLRLASAITHRSSQALLVQALDAYLDTLPEVEELARHCSQPDSLGDPR